LGFVFLFFVFVDGSPGDRNYVYQSCLSHCEQMNCSTSIGLKEFYSKQSFFESIFRWTCPDECAYRCMWKTVEHLQAEGQPIVQFHGKWPFRRFLGVQEPASTFFSVFNFVSNYFFGLKILRRHLRATVYPLYTMWFVFCLISMNAWIWSTVFHSRDKPMTEIFDYIAAISLVFSQFACCLIRIGYRTPYQRLSYLFVSLLAIFFVYHAHYLLFVQMDYGYNMKVNISFGLINVVCWAIWSLFHLQAGRIYVWPCLVSVILAMLFAGLELADFPPILWTIDAHSLWHFSTIFLPILWYRFVVADSTFLLFNV